MGWYMTVIPHLLPGRLHKLQHNGEKTQNPSSAEVERGNDLETQNLCEDYHQNKVKSVEKPHRAGTRETEAGAESF